MSPLEVFVRAEVQLSVSALPQDWANYSLIIEVTISLDRAPVLVH